MEPRDLKSCGCGKHRGGLRALADPLMSVPLLGICGQALPSQVCGGRPKPDLGGGGVGKLILSPPTLHPQWLQFPGPTSLCTGSWLGREQRGKPVGPLSHSYPLPLPMAKWGWEKL